MKRLEKSIVLHCLHTDRIWKRLWICSYARTRLIRWVMDQSTREPYTVGGEFILTVDGGATVNNLLIEL